MSGTPLRPQSPEGRRAPSHLATVPQTKQGRLPAALGLMDQGPVSRPGASTRAQARESPACGKQTRRSYVRAPGSHEPRTWRPCPSFCEFQSSGSWAPRVSHKQRGLGWLLAVLFVKFRITLKNKVPKKQLN